MRGSCALLFLLYILLQSSAFAQENRLVVLAGEGNVAAVKELITSGADPNVVDNTKVHGWTALMAAAKAGNDPLAAFLIQAHADLNATNEYGATALDVAIANGHLLVARKIKAAGGTGRSPVPELPPTDVGANKPREDSNVVSALADKDPNVQLPAAIELGQKGDARAVAVLISGLRNSRADLRLQATEALGRIRRAGSRTNFLTLP